MLKKKKEICPICENGDKIIKVLTAKDIENILKEIHDFVYRLEEMSCNYNDVEIKIKANGDIIIGGEYW